MRSLSLCFSPAALVVVGAIAAVSCSDPAAPIPVALVAVEPDSVIVMLGTTGQFTATLRDANGNTLANRTIAWTSADQSKVTVSSTGLVTAVAPGRIPVTARSEGKSATGMVVSRAPVATITVAPDSVNVSAGTTAQFTATLRDSDGNVLTGRTIVWSTGDAAVVSISQTGVVTGGSPGRALITATAEGKSATGIVGVGVAVRDFNIIAAQFTQGVQDAGSTLPIVLSGNAAVVNVLIGSNVAGSASMQVVLRLFNAAGTLIRSDTALTTRPFSANPSYLVPSVQFLVPASVLQAGLKWEVVRDPRLVVPDAAAENDIFPGAGPATLATIAVPPIKVRFVPITLDANGGATGSISTGAIPEFMQTFHSVHPIGVIDAHVGEPFTFGVSFGPGPSGGDSPFWQQLLFDLDLARLADPFEPDAHWYGVVVPPAGFNFTVFGGFSYIPSSGTATGPQTRTSASVQLNWFSNPTQARDLVAHELGHAFGRRHAPGCGAGSPDASYPVPSGQLDVAGHNVFEWQRGAATSAVTVPATTGDVMGYCHPVWASTYTYRAVQLFRGQILASPAMETFFRSDAQSARQRVLLLRGAIELGRSLHLEPAFVLDARASLPSSAGEYRVEGFAEDGRLLFSRTVEPSELDHAPTIRHFAIAIPASPALEAALATVVLRGPEGEARLNGFSSFNPGEGLSDGVVAARRGANGTVLASCPAAARGIVVFNAITGTVIGSTSLPALRATIPERTPITVLCSDGVRTRRTNITPS